VLSNGNNSRTLGQWQAGNDDLGWSLSIHDLFFQLTREGNDPSTPQIVMHVVSQGIVSVHAGLLQSLRTHENCHPG
jgi:hypothetical protein